MSPKRLCKPWISSGILKSIKSKFRYLKVYKLGAIREANNRNYRNRLNSLTGQEKRDYYIKTKLE